jgi:two-component system response regulator YesN
MYTLLIADDEPLERETLRFFVENSNLPIDRIIECENGKEVVDRIREYRPDICILDIKMPGLTGIEALGEIKAFDKGIVVIIQTAYSYFNYAVEALRLGAFEYTLKPTSREVVIGVLRKAIAHIDKNDNIEGSEEWRHSEAPAPGQEIRKHTREVEAIQGYIIDKYPEKISLDSLADIVGFSKYHISHLFKEVYGKTIMEYLIEIRMGHAKELLAGTNLSIKEIAYKVGYTEANYFIWAFKKYTGISPGEYRATSDRT